MAWHGMAWAERGGFAIGENRSGLGRFDGVASLACCARRYVALWIALVGWREGEQREGEKEKGEKEKGGGGGREQMRSPGSTWV